jgi:pyrroloquinoline quinone (PQQ) biosynthesis protein C
MFQNSFFRALREKRISLAGMRLFANEYFAASNGFPRILATACAAIKTDELRMPVVENLWDEHGRGDILKSHRLMLLHFLRFFDMEPTETLRGPAMQYVDAMIDMCRGATESQLLGILCPGCEAFTPREYTLIAFCVKRDFAPPDTALHFFTDHIRHDRGHAEAFANAFDLAVTSQEDFGFAVRGARQAIEVERQFWENIYALILDKSGG